MKMKYTWVSRDMVRMIIPADSQSMQTVRRAEISVQRVESINT